MDGETGERRALVRSIEIQYKPQWFGAGESTLNIPLALVIEREPYWENPTATTLPDVAPSAAACVVYDYTSGAGQDVVGDVGARLRYFEILTDATKSVNTFWMGVRSANKHGSTGITNFVNIWECEDGQNKTDASDTVDSSASGGDRVTVSESGVDWDDGEFHPCMNLRLQNVTANYGDQFGNFLWLLRSKVTAGTWDVRLGFTLGLTLPDTSPPLDIHKEIVEVSTSANWMMHEMGTMPISLRNIQAITISDRSVSAEQYYLVTIWARRTSGAGDLHLDCLIPIPIDEGFVKLQGLWQFFGETVMFGHAPHGAKGALGTTSGIYSEPYELKSLENFVLPPGDGRIYCVYSYSTYHQLTATITFNDSNDGKYYERWLSLRGSE
jgi:hypothetical protein